MDADASRTARLLLDEAKRWRKECRFPEALQAAQVALEALDGQEESHDLRSRAIYAEAVARYHLGDDVGAFVGATKVLSMAEAGMPQKSATIGECFLLRVRASVNWTRIPLADKFRMCDEADAWARATGRDDFQPDFLCERAQILAAAGRLREAKDVASEALARARSRDGERSDSARNASLMLVKLAMQSGDWRLVEERCEAVLDEPDCGDLQQLEAYRKLSSAALETGRPAEAIRHARRAVELSSRMGDLARLWSLMDLADAQRDAGQSSEEVEGELVAAARRLVAARPADGDMHDILGQALHSVGSYREALAAFDRAVELVPLEAASHFGRGAALNWLGRHSEALPALDRALELNPHHWRAHWYRAHSLSKLDRLEDSLRAYDRTLELRPRLAKVHSHRGTVLSRLGRHREAVAAHDQAIAIRPDDPEVHLERGYTLSRQAKGSEAVAAIARAIRLRPDTATPHHELGFELSKLERHDEAVASYDRAIALRPDRARTHWRRARSLAALGRIQEARSAADRAVELDPENTEFRELRASLEPSG